MLDHSFTNSVVFFLTLMFFDLRVGESICVEVNWAAHMVTKEVVLAIMRFGSN